MPAIPEQYSVAGAYDAMRRALAVACSVYGWHDLAVQLETGNTREVAEAAVLAEARVRQWYCNSTQ